jgi:phage-related protein
MKDVAFLGDSLERIRQFPGNARSDIGYQIHRLQNGMQPVDFKPMPTIGRGVEEIRIRDGHGAFRVIYTARRPDAVYVLHAFQKTTAQTAQRDIELAKQRFSELTG